MVARDISRLLALVLGLLLALPAVAQQGASVNTPPGSVWTYLGPTLGASWVFPANQFVVPACAAAPVDQSVCIQTAATQVCTSFGGGYLFIGPGQWKFHDITFRCPVSVIGAGVGTTIVDYSASPTGFGFMWEPTGWPAVKLADLMKGGGIRDVGFVRTGSNQNTGIIVHGTQDFVAENLRLVDAWNGFATKGVHNIKFSNIDMKGTYNINYDFVGDLTGIRDDGSACVAGDPVCSTRSDWFQLGQLFNLDNRQTNICINIVGYVNTLNSIGPIACEGPDIGLKATCPPGLAPNGNECPHYIFLDNFQTEFFKSYGYFLQDTYDVKMSKPYSYGDGAVSINAAYISTLNYGSATGCSGTQCNPPGKVIFDHGLFFAARNDCVLAQAAAGTSLMDVVLSGNQVNGCNISNSGYGAVSVAPVGGNVWYGRFNGNSLCSSGGFSSPSVQAYGVKYGATARNFVGAGNGYFECAVPVVNSHFSNTDAGGNPPPGTGTITETDGKIGTTGTIVYAIGNAYAGTVTITPGGTGIGSQGFFTMTLPANVTMQPGMLCGLILSTNWGNGSTIFTVTTNTTSSTYVWNNIVNGVATALTAAQTYNVGYRCSGF